MWRVSSSTGTSMHLKDSKGLQYLAELVSRSGQELHVTQLAELGETPGDAGTVLDERAKRQYKERLEALRDQLEEARGFGDTRREERAQSEIDAIAEQLARAVGLGGRDRKLGSQVERVRINVQRRLRDAIQRIEEYDRRPWSLSRGDHKDRRFLYIFATVAPQDKNARAGRGTSFHAAEREEVRRQQAHDQHRPKQGPRSSLHGRHERPGLRRRRRPHGDRSRQPWRDPRSAGQRRNEAHPREARQGDARPDDDVRRHDRRGGQGRLSRPHARDPDRPVRDDEASLSRRPAARRRPSRSTSSAIADGKLVEHWVGRDDILMLRQLGHFSIGGLRAAIHDRRLRIAQRRGSSASRCSAGPRAAERRATQRARASRHRRRRRRAPTRTRRS